MAVQRTAAAEVDRAPLLDRPDALGRGGCQLAEQPVQVVAVDPPCAVHQAARVGEVAGAQFVDHDLRRREHPGDVAHAAGMVQVDVGDHHRGQVARPHAQRGERVPHHRRRRRRPGLHQARTVGEDQVSGGNLAVSRHPGVDLEHIVPQRGDPGVAVPAEICLVHVGIVPEVPAGFAGGWVKHLRLSHADSYIVSTICPQQAGRRSSCGAQATPVHGGCTGKARKGSFERNARDSIRRRACHGRRRSAVQRGRPDVGSACRDHRSHAARCRAAPV